MLPLFAVMYIEVVPGWEFTADTVRVDVALATVELSVTAVWLRVAATNVPKGEGGWRSSVTVPVNPPLPVTVSIEFLDVPCGMVRLPGLASTIKSGCARTASSSALWLIELVVAFRLITY